VKLSYNIKKSREVRMRRTKGGGEE